MLLRQRLVFQLCYFTFVTSFGRSREGARVVTVSSSASCFASSGGGLEIGNPNGEKTYGAWPSYLLSKQFQRRASDAGLDWLTAATLLRAWSIPISARLFAKTPREGASTQVYPWFAMDEAKARALRDASEELGRVRFDLTAVVPTTDGAAAGGVEISAEESSDVSGDEGDIADASL